MKRKVIAVPLIAIVVAVVLLLSNRPGPAPSTGHVTKVTVDAGRLPVTCSLLGAELRLERMERTTPNQVFIRFRARDTRHGHTSGVLRVSNASLVRAAGSPRVLRFGYWEDSFALRGHAEWGTSMPVAQGCSSLTMEQSVYLDRPEKNLKFKFKDISPADLPVTRKIGDVEATLQRVYVNEAVKRHGVRATFYDMTPGSRAFAVEVRMRSPNGYTQILEGFTLRPDADDSRPTLIDDKGKAHSLTGAIVCQEDVRYRPSPPVVSIFERLLAAVDEKRAMAIARRRREAVKREMSARQTRIYAYPVIDPPPSRFSIEIPLAIPPDPADTAVVTFKSISVPQTVSP